MIDQQRCQAVLQAMLCMQRWPWEQGVASQALIAAGETDLAILLAHDAVTNRFKDGRLAMKNDRYASLDPASNGEAVLLAYQHTGEKKYADAAEDMLEYLLHRAPRTKEGILYHNVNEGQVWIDAAFMAPPFLAMMGYKDEAVRQLLGFRDILFDHSTGLYSHIWDDDLQVFERKAFWGVGNGWMMAGIAKTMDYLTSACEKEQLRECVIGLIASVLRYRRSDGLFHDVLDHADTFIETNLAQMLSYTIYKGIWAGWLDKSLKETADISREAVYRKVDNRGFVRDVCGSPKFDRPGTAVEGQAFFLFMEHSLHQLYQSSEEKNV